jgi:hypothetical protein
MAIRARSTRRANSTLSPGRTASDLMADACQDQAQQPQDVRIVVDEQDSHEFIIGNCISPEETRCAHLELARSKPALP